MAKGGRRPGAGRKSKASELGLTSLIDDRLSRAEWGDIIDNLYAIAKGNDPKAAVSASSLLLNYRFGKPVEKHEHSGGDEPIILKVVYEKPRNSNPLA